MGPGKVLPERDSLRISRVGEGSGEAFFSTNFIAGILGVLVLVRFCLVMFRFGVSSGMGRALHR